jgi:ketosteroid isomerase-like protein
MRRQQKEHIRRLFSALIDGRVDDFLAGCSDDLVVTTRGSTPTPTTLTRIDIYDWYGSLQALSPTSLQSSVEVGKVEGNKATVILRHSFGRNGIDYNLEMLNLVEFRHGLLAEWSSYPLNLSEYARAWRTQEVATLASA